MIHRCLSSRQSISQLDNLHRIIRSAVDIVLRVVTARAFRS